MGDSKLLMNECSVSIGEKQSYLSTQYIKAMHKKLKKLYTLHLLIATRGLFATDHVILNHGQVTWTTPELAPPSPNYHTTPTGGRFSSRQWARIVLVVERGVPPHICLEQQRNYSQAMADERRALVLRLEHNETEKEELRCIAEMRTSNVENRARRKKLLGSKKANIS
ncbi:ion_trans domain-containing protein [Trichonephila clavipes]|nr:ion_trans domain-containing protein [Trichonephila clavipes]